jgi:hypothetical protein
VAERRRLPRRTALKRTASAASAIMARGLLTKQPDVVANPTASRQLWLISPPAPHGSGSIQGCMSCIFTGARSRHRRCERGWDRPLRAHPGGLLPSHTLQQPLHHHQRLTSHEPAPCLSSRPARISHPPHIPSIYPGPVVAMCCQTLTLRLGFPPRRPILALTFGLQNDRQVRPPVQASTPDAEEAT